MRITRRLAVPTLFVVLAIAARAEVQRAMTLIDLINLPGVSGAQLSPDGKQFIYTRSEADWKSNKRISHIWRMNADGTDAVQLTNGTDGENGGRWSPDSRTIAFTAKRGEAEVPQIYVIPADGGEARQLSTHATAPGNLQWSPDGATIYFSAAEPKTDEQKAKDKAKDDVFAFNENYKQTHLWRIDVASKTEKRLTEGDFTVGGFRLSRDGKLIAFNRAPNPLLDSMESSEVWVMESTGANPRQLTHNSVVEMGATLSPDNSMVLFSTQSNDKLEGTYYSRKLFVMPASGGTARHVTAGFPYEVGQAEWAPDGKSIFFMANMGVHSELFQVDLAGGRPKQLTSGDHSIWGSDIVAGKHVLTISEPTNPGEIWMMAVGSSGPPTRVSHFFDFVARDYKLPKQERIEWKGADGKTVEGLLYYPLDYQPGRRYPLCVQTHGGPQASDKFGFPYGTDYVPVLAAKGYAVLKPNYRGSTGYGDEFLRDMVGHYFQNAHLDVMAGVDKVIAMGIADPDKMVKMGWSGGGHMTNKIITFTNRFKAAASGAGAADWQSMYAQSDTRTYRTPWFGGTPWQKNAPIDKYWDASPLKYVSNVATPTIFLVGQNDERVPMPQSVEMYRALKSNGVPTHLYVAPREGHGWGELRHALFKMNVELDWFEKYATKRPYTWEKAPGDDAKKDARPTTTPTSQ